MGIGGKYVYDGYSNSALAVLLMFVVYSVTIAL